MKFYLDSKIWNEKDKQIKMTQNDLKIANLQHSRSKIFNGDLYANAA